MKKSQGITLTVLAAMGMASPAQQPPSPTAPPASAAPTQLRTCEERAMAARAAGLPVTDTCGTQSGTHGAVRGGFGATGKTNPSGGG
jgi:hypothetical protein